jgi:hypothetical protein
MADSSDFREAPTQVSARHAENVEVVEALRRIGFVAREAKRSGCTINEDKQRSKEPP